LSFADDQVILAQEYEDLEYMTRKLVEEYGLSLNISKTKHMMISKGQHPPVRLTINGQDIDQMETSLGNTVNAK